VEQAVITYEENHCAAVQTRAFVYIGVWRRDMKMSLLWWRSILILPWRRRLLPVATRRRLVSAEYFGCPII